MCIRDSVFAGEGILATASQERAAQDVVSDWVGDANTLRVGQVAVDGALVSVDIAGAEAIPDARQLQRELSEALGLSVEVVIEFTPSAQITVSDTGEVSTDRAPGLVTGR